MLSGNTPQLDGFTTFGLQSPMYELSVWVLSCAVGQPNLVCQENDLQCHCQSLQTGQCRSAIPRVCLPGVSPRRVFSQAKGERGVCSRYVPQRTPRHRLRGQPPGAASG